MKYLILPTDQAEFRNWKAARDINCKPETVYRWSISIVSETETALHVGDGDGLTAEELAQCVNELPQ